MGSRDLEAPELEGDARAPRGRAGRTIGRQAPLPCHRLMDGGSDGLQPRRRLRAFASWAMTRNGRAGAR